jgi:hypothetical protein
MACQGKFRDVFVSFALSIVLCGEGDLRLTWPDSLRGFMCYYGNYRYKSPEQSNPIACKVD